MRALGIVLVVLGLLAPGAVTPASAVRPAAQRAAHHRTVRPARSGTPCIEWVFSDPAKSDFKKVTIPKTEKAYIFRTRDKVRKKQPVVILLHGNNGTECSLWWAARLLAARNYTAVVIKSKQYTHDSLDRAGKSALTWVRSDANPWRKKVDETRVALLGHSLGAHAAADLQQKKKLDLTTIVALDNLRQYVKYDLSAGTSCTVKDGEGQITPVVPALSIGSRQSCYDNDHGTAADDGVEPDKLTGYRTWRAAEVPVYQATLAYTRHEWYSGKKDFNQQHETQLVKASKYIVTWLDIFMRDKVDQYPSLFAPTFGGVPLTKLLSGAKGKGFGSAAYLPADGTWTGEECTDLRTLECVAPIP